MVSSWIDIPNKSLILSLRFFLTKNLIIPGISLCDLCQYFISIIQEDRRTGHWLQHKWWTQLSSLRGCPRAIEKRKWGLTESFLYVFIVKSFYCFEETNDMRLVRILIEAAKCGDTLNWKKKYIERLWIVICFQNTKKCISLLCKKSNYTLFKSWNSREIIYKNEQKDSLWMIIIIISHRWHRNHFTRWKNELIKHLLS